MGFNDSYTNFPSRWKYPDDKLKVINGTPELEKCLKMVFEPQNFIGRYKVLDDCIASFNQYLAYDNLKVIRKDKYITFSKADDIDFSYKNEEIDEELDEKENFLNKEYKDISLEGIGLDSSLTNVLTLRLKEIRKCLNADTPLAVIFLSGSVLEGLLLGFAMNHPKEFNQSTSVPKKEGENKPFQ